jgi:hypothetical protein
MQVGWLGLGAMGAVGGADLTVIMVTTPEQVEQAQFAPGGAAGARGREHRGGHGDGRARGGHLDRGHPDVGPSPGSTQVVIRRHGL